MQKENKYNIALIVLLALQTLMILLALAYAFWGQYDHNQSSNIWSIIWDGGVEGIRMVSNIAALCVGIAAFRGRGDNLLQGKLSIALLVSVPVSIFCLVLALGAHY